jgi:hypothetical protein
MREGRGTYDKQFHDALSVLVVLLETAFSGDKACQAPVLQEVLQPGHEDLCFNVLATSCYCDGNANL